MKSKKMIKLIVSLCVLSCLNFIMYSNVSALSRQIFITVKMNGNYIKTDVSPFIKDNRTYVSVRFVAEALDATVDWVDEEKKVIIYGRTKYIELTVGSKEVMVNGEKQMMDAAAEISNGRTMVPLRFVSENLDCNVKWDNLTYTVLINKEGAIIPEAYIYNRPYTDEDLIWLARIINVEGGGQSIDTKVAIANVVLNRVKSPEFPDTVRDVIFDKEYCVQFPPAHREGFSEMVPHPECVIAAKMALEGINNIDKCLYFNNVPFKNKSKDFYKKIDGEYFYY
ncbi:MAG: stalk domain-containing protein [Bacillota bacterium]